MHQLDHIESMLRDLLAAVKPAAPPADLISAAFVQKSVAFLFQSLMQDRMIEAIKEYRSLTGAPLKESKDAMENLKEHFREQGRKGR